jgi:hypothetical protein
MSYESKGGEKRRNGIRCENGGKLERRQKKLHVAVKGVMLRKFIVLPKI